MEVCQVNVEKSLNMRARIVVLLTSFMLFSAGAALAQEDLYAQIVPLEAAVASGSATRAQQLQLARLYNRAGRFYEGSKIASQLLVADPNDADAKSVRDESTRGLRDVTDKNIAEAQARVNASGATDQDRLALANAYFEGGSYGAAADIYDRLPAALLDRDTQLRHARALAWSSRLDSAEREYARILKVQSTPELELEYGRLLSWMGASAAAVQTLTRAYEANRNEDNAIALANARAWSGDREGALKLLTDFTSANPGAGQAKELLSQLSASPDLQLERVNRIIEVQPYNLALQLEKARLLVAAGRDAEALRTIQFIREHSTQEVAGLDELEQRARTHREQEIAKIAGQLNSLDRRNAQSADQLLTLAKAYVGLDDYPTAIGLYEDYLRQRPDDADARVQYARVLNWSRRYPAAARQYEILLQKNPERADLRYEYGQVLSYESDFNGAMRTFQSLTDVSSNPRANLYSDVPAKAHFNMGQIYRWFGWNEHAVEEQNRALLLDGSYGPARQELDLVRHLRPTSNVGAQYSYVTDSNDFTLKRIDLTAEKWTSQRTAFDVGVGRHEFEYRGDSVFANRINAGAAYRWNDRTTFRATAGLNFYEEGLGTRPFAGIGATFMPNLQSRASADFNHYDLVYDVFTFNSLTEPGTTGTANNFRDPIDINDFRGHYDYNSGGFWSWLADASYGFISDNNKRAAAHGLLTFRLFKKPFVAVKADGRYLSYDFRTNRYWSPPSYHSYAGVLQVGDNFRERFFWNVEGKLGKSYESGTSSDLRSFEANVTVPVTGLIDIIGNYGYGRSGRIDSILGGTGNDFVNYWQRHWFVGVRLKQLLSRDERRDRNPYYYDDRPLTGSPVIPPLGEAH